MSNEILVLVGTAATIGFVHTVIGPDHYLPFIVLSKARQWSSIKTFVITVLCGIGHVLSSIVLGFAGIALGVAVLKLENIESIRGDLAGWFLLAFGLTYFVWGLHRAIRNRPHRHSHLHVAEEHSHSHGHRGEHTHPHKTDWKALTPWVLFTIFVFGPCEPLIPLIMYPAAKGSMWAVALVATIFGVVTVGTMLTIVLASSYGLSKIPFRKLERYSHAMAGFAILLCGGAIKLGL